MKLYETFFKEITRLYIYTTIYQAFVSFYKICFNLYKIITRSNEILFLYFSG